jgi:hypothetical protein
VLPGAIKEPPQTLVLAGGSFGWGGPRIKWIDPLTPGAAPFVLDDVTEQNEWDGFTGELRGMAHSLNILLAKLNNAANPC